MPTSFWGLALYVFALFPGFAFVFAREGHRVTGKRSALRETATVIFVSMICDAIVVSLFVLCTLWWPELRARVIELLSGDLDWSRYNFGLVALAFLCSLSLATLLGFLLGTKWVHEHGLRLLWNAEIPRDTSAWKKVLLPDDDVEVRVGLNLKSGMWISGTLYDFDNDPDNNPHRTITLNKSIRVRPSGQLEDAELDDTDWVIVEAGDIEMLQAAYYERPATAEPAAAPRPTPRIWPAIVAVTTGGLAMCGSVVLMAVRIPTPAYWLLTGGLLTAAIGLAALAWIRRGA